VTPSDKTSFGDYLQPLCYKSFDFSVLQGHTRLVVSFVSHWQQTIQYYDI